LKSAEPQAKRPLDLHHSAGHDQKLQWSMQELHETIEMAQGLLAEMKEDMESSAKRYIEQQAHVFELADVLNQAGLSAETRHNEEPKRDDEEKQDATET
jgi:hypothetical protein